MLHTTTTLLLLVSYVTYDPSKIFITKLSTEYMHRYGNLAQKSKKFMIKETIFVCMCVWRSGNTNLAFSYNIRSSAWNLWLELFSQRYAITVKMAQNLISEGWSHMGLLTGRNCYVRNTGTMNSQSEFEMSSNNVPQLVIFLLPFIKIININVRKITA